MVLSMMGDEFTRTALIWFVYERTRSAEAVGLLLVAFTGPILVGGLAAGWALDRFDRRRVIILDSLFRAAAVASIPLLYLFGILELWHIYAVAALHGLLMMIPLAGTPALLPSLVPAEGLATANALEVLGYTVGGVVGPSAAGLLIAAVGAPLTVAVNVATFLVFALLLSGVQVETPRKAPAPTAASPREGGILWLLFGNRILLSTTLMFLFYNVGAALMGVWLPILAEDRLKGGPELYGSLLSAIALGQVTSSIIAGAVAAKLPLGKAIACSQAMAGLSVGLIAAAPTAWAAALVLMVYGAAAAPLTIWAQTLRMRIIPAAMRGRAFALLRMLMQGGRPLGGALGAFALPLLGVPLPILASALIILVPGAAGLLVKELREAGVPGGARPEEGAPKT